MFRKFSLLMICCLAIFFLQTTVTQALAAPAQDFQQGWREFHALVDSKEKAKYRSHWMQIKERFQSAYQANPQGSYAPKSLYYLGRTYQELGKRSFLNKDFQKALKYFEQMVREFPSHSWADDAKLYQAKIQLENLQNPEQAYLELLYIEHNYPDGDMLSKAKEMLKELDREFMQQVGISPEEHQKRLQEKQSEKSQGSNSSQQRSALQDIRHWSSDEYTRVVLDLDQAAEFEHFLLKPNQTQNKPHRLVVDLQNVALGQKVEKELAIQDGVVQRVRSARRKNQVSRVVLDIENLEDYRVFSLQNPFRVVLDLHDSTQGKGKKTLAQTTEVPQGFSLDAQSKAMTESLVEQLGLGIQTVMIDAGHGGKDPGAVASGVLEKDVTLRFAKILGEILEERGLEVKYTRETDKFLPLEERTALANSKKADLFLSVHVNAHKNRKVSGFEVYYLNLAQSEDSVRVAARENAVSENKISDLQMILTDLMLNSKIKESRNLANVVLTSSMDYSKQFYSLNDNGVRRAPFYVLMGAKMPAVLLELGYLTNPRDRKNLQSYAYLKRLAWGMANGIEEYKKNIQEYASLDN